GVTAALEGRTRLGVRELEGRARLVGRGGRTSDEGRRRRRGQVDPPAVVRRQADVAGGVATLKGERVRAFGERREGAAAGTRRRRTAVEAALERRRIAVGPR